jgi:hypothetical protein
MGRIGLVATGVLIVLAMLAAHSFGFLGTDDFLYVGKLLAGWTAYTCVIALLYAGLEKLIPGILCAPPAEESLPPPPAA